MKNHTSCTGKCVRNAKLCPEDRFNQDSDTCVCTCKHKARNCSDNHRYVTSLVSVSPHRVWPRPACSLQNPVQRKAFTKGNCKLFCSPLASFCNSYCSCVFFVRWNNADHVCACECHLGPKDETLKKVTIYLVFWVLYVNQSLLIAEIYQNSITSTTLTWLRPPRPSHDHQCEIVWIYLVFCVLYVNQSSLIAEIYQHSITSTTLTWLRPPRPSHDHQCEIVWIYLVFCVLYVNQSSLIAEIYQHSITSTTSTWLRPPRPSHGL